LEFNGMQNYVEERDGGYYIAGTRISLASVVHAFQDGESPEGILRSFPSRTANRRKEFSDPFRWPVPSSGFMGRSRSTSKNKEKVEGYLKDQEQRWDELRKKRPKSGDAVTKRLRAAKEQASLRRS
jgi:hypothetical protein